MNEDFTYLLGGLYFKTIDISFDKLKTIFLLLKELGYSYHDDDVKIFEDSIEATKYYIIDDFTKSVNSFNIEYANNRFNNLYHEINTIVLFKLLKYITDNLNIQQVLNMVVIDCEYNKHSYLVGQYLTEMGIKYDSESTDKGNFILAYSHKGIEKKLSYEYGYQYKNKNCPHLDFYTFIVIHEIYQEKKKLKNKKRKNG